MSKVTVGRRGRITTGATVLGVLVLAGCKLGVAPVTYEMTDPDDVDWPLRPLGLATG